MVKRGDKLAERAVFRFFARLGLLLQKISAFLFTRRDFREFLPRCFGRMTISGTGILRIVNRFLASLVRLSILSTFRAGGSDLDRFALEIVPRSSRKSIPTSILIAERLDFRPSTRPIPFYSSRSTFAPFQQRSSSLEKTKEEKTKEKFFVHRFRGWEKI